MGDREGQTIGALKECNSRGASKLLAVPCNGRKPARSFLECPFISIAGLPSAGRSRLHAADPTLSSSSS